MHAYVKRGETLLNYSTRCFSEVEQNKEKEKEKDKDKEKKEKKTKKKDKVKESEDTQKTNKTTKQERQSNISAGEVTIKTSCTVSSVQGQKTFSLNHRFNIILLAFHSI